ncbi:MAG: hypothetical protein D6820_03600 [Lentisphaerae bacterium]|nr:MAG: hypothetical protein D6820_03600 [Lentisphaerota bacterium]
MKTGEHQQSGKRAIPGGMIALLIAVPILVATMWYGISNQYKNIGLYAIAMGMGSWSVSGWGVHSVRKWQEWRTNKKSGDKT